MSTREKLIAEIDGITNDNADFEQMMRLLQRCRTALSADTAVRDAVLVEQRLRDALQRIADRYPCSTNQTEQEIARAALAASLE